MGKSKIEFKLKRVLYPKNLILEIGTYSIIACELVNLIEGDEIVLNKTYNNFTLISYTPVLFNEFESYIGEVESEEGKFGISYHLSQLEREEKGISEGEKLSFLEAVFTPIQKDNLIKTYGIGVYDIIAKHETEKLMQVKGIGEKTIQYVYHKFENNLKYQTLICELSEYGLTQSMMDNLLEKYKDPKIVVKKVRENIYVLASEINGIGFKRCDYFALKSGLPPTNQARIEAYLQYLLYQQAENGNSWVSPQPLLNSISINLGVEVPKEIIKNALYNLRDQKILWWNEEKTQMGLYYYRKLEEDIYFNIKRIDSNINHPYKRNTELEKRVIEKAERETGFKLTEEQLEAVEGILSNKVSILTAGAGMGKTYLTKIIGEVYKIQGFEPCFCTLSGKAAARIYEATGLQGATIHKTLGYNPQTNEFVFNRSNPLGHSIIIIDEASFLGGELFRNLLEAVPDESRLVLVGDDKQLPPIGACNIFYDMINSGKIKINRLTKIHRQAQDSGIIEAATKVRRGEQIVPNGWYGIKTLGKLQDFTLDTYEDRLISRPKLLDYYKTRVKNLQEAANTQIILATKHKGDTNTFDINNAIQEYLNPPTPNKKEILLKRNDKDFYIREGDRVINRKNDYKAVIYKPTTYENTTEIFNGFCGRVEKIINDKIIVKFEMCDYLIVFTRDKLKNLELSYALTVHLYQGSQVNNIIYLIDNTSYIMNTRELVYTALTRAKKSCILLAQSEALRHAIQTPQVMNKHTFLKFLLQEK